MDSYEDYIKTQKVFKSPLNNLFNKLKPAHVIGIICLFFVANNIVKNNHDSNWIYFAVGGLGLLYLFSIMREEQTKNLIPRNVALEIAHKDLLAEIAQGRVFPVGTKINPIIYFKDQFVDSGDGPKVIKYNLGFRVKEQDKSEKDIIYQMNPYTGESKGIIEKPLGFTGQDIKDLQLIFPEKFTEEKPK